MKRRITIITLIMAMVLSTGANVFAEDETLEYSAPQYFELKNPSASMYWIDGYSATCVKDFDRSSIACADIDTDYQLKMDGNDQALIGFELYDKNEDRQIADLNKTLSLFSDVMPKVGDSFSNQMGIKLNKDDLAKAKPGVYRATIGIKWNLTCVLEGTDIMLADGTTKKAEDIKVGDEIRTFDFFTGKTSSRAVLYNIKDTNRTTNVIHISLDNGTTLDVSDCQSLFDMDKRQYFDVSDETASTSIGRNVMYIDGEKVTTAKITNVTSEVKVCNSYEIFSEYDMNFVANGVLTIEPGMWYDGLYKIDSDLKINQEQYQADVEKYGQYTYKDFKKYYGEDTFAKVRAADLKIAVGKGLISEEELFELTEEWVPIKKAANETKKTMPKTMMLTSSAPLLTSATTTDATTEIVVVISDTAETKTTPTDTSDSNNIALYCIGMLIAFAGITIALYKRRTN